MQLKIIILLHLYEIHVVLASAMELQEFVNDVMKYVDFYELNDYSDYIICVILSYCRQDIFHINIFDFVISLLVLWCSRVFCSQQQYIIFPTLQEQVQL